MTVKEIIETLEEIRKKLCKEAEETPLDQSGEWLNTMGKIDGISIALEQIRNIKN